VNGDYTNLWNSVPVTENILYKVLINSAVW
jgi:hypothetical protein